MEEIRTVDELVQSARDAMASERMSEALALTLEACELAPDNASLLLSAGVLAGQTGDTVTAERCLRRSLALHPDSATAHENLAVALVANGQVEQGLAHIDNALALRDHPGSHNRRGFILASLGRHPEAIRAFRAAIDKGPGLADAHNNLGVSLQVVGDAGAALAAYTRCCELTPTNAEAWNNRGLALQALGRIDEAADAHRAALRFDANNADYLAELAGTLERTNQLDESREAVDRALSIQPAQNKARLVDAVLLRLSGNPESAAARLTSLLASQLESDADEQDRGEIEVELARCLDQLGRYADAWEHNASGQQRLMRSWSSRPQPDEYLREIDASRRWPMPVNSGEPDSASPAFLIGFPRSGTTLTGRILDAHPQINSSDEWPLIPRLLRYAVDDLGLTPGQLDEPQRELLAADYWRLAAEYGVEPSDGRLLDKLPLNITRLGFIRQVFPRAPIFVALRDPRDVCLSAFMQSFKPNRAMAHFTRYEDAARLYDAVMRDWSVRRDETSPGFAESRYEDLVIDFETATTRLLNHLGLEWDARIADFYRHSQGRYLSTPSYQAVAEPVNDKAVGRWRHYRDQIENEGAALAPFIDIFGYE